MQMNNFSPQRLMSCKPKESKQPGGKKKMKGQKKKQDKSSPEKSYANPSRQRKPLAGC